MASREDVNSEEIERVLRYYADYAPDEVEDETEIVRMIREYRSEYGDQYPFHLLYMSGEFGIPVDDYDETRKKLTEFYLKYDPKKARDEKHQDEVVELFWWKHGVDYSAPLWSHLREAYGNPPRAMVKQMNAVYRRLGIEPDSEKITMYWRNFGVYATRRLTYLLARTNTQMEPYYDGPRIPFEGKYKGKFPVKVEGAKAIVWFESVCGSKLLLIGEHHGNEGTGFELMSYLDSFEGDRCFDVYIEKPHNWMAVKEAKNTTQVAGGGDGLLTNLDEYWSKPYVARENMRWHFFDTRGSAGEEILNASNPFFDNINHLSQFGTDLRTLSAEFSPLERFVLLTGERHMLASEEAFVRLLRKYDAMFAAWEPEARKYIGRQSMGMSPEQLAIRRDRTQKGKAKFLKSNRDISLSALDAKIKLWYENRVQRASYKKALWGAMDLYGFYRMFSVFVPRPGDKESRCPMRQENIVVVAGQQHIAWLVQLISYVFGVEGALYYTPNKMTYLFRKRTEFF